MDEETVPMLILSVSEDGVSVEADWTPGADLTRFANLILRTHAGDLVGLVNQAVARAASRNGEPAKADQVRDFLRRNLPGKDPSGPVVSPLRTFRHLAQSTLS